MAKFEDPGTPVSRYCDALRANPNKVGFLVEGDSWFSFPKWLRTNALQELRTINDGKAAFLNFAGTGDDARGMMSGVQYDELLILLDERRQENNDELRFDAILFSGGGNDIVGPGMLPLLKPYRNGMTEHDCLHQARFVSRLRQIEAAYEELILLRDEYLPTRPIFVHTYDYLQPTGKGVLTEGPWLLPYLQDEKYGKQIPKGFHAPVVKLLVDGFAEMLNRLAANHANVVKVDARGTLQPAEWQDEIHPSAAGFRKIANQFQAKLKTVFPALPPFQQSTQGIQPPSP